jgi:hypothetical protein
MEERRGNGRERRERRESNPNSKNLERERLWKMRYFWVQIT